MALFALGQCFLSEPCAPHVRGLWQCFKRTSELTCPCCKVCWQDFQDQIDHLFDTGKLRKEVFVPDFFSGEIKKLKICHRKVRPELMKKYSIEQCDKHTGEPLYDPPLVLGLGMEDAEVQDRLRSAERDDGILWITDGLTALKWVPPAMVNAWCCCLCCCLDDRLQFQEKLMNGEAYKVTCCGPFFTKGEMRVLPVKGHIGKPGELVVIVSSPGDFHPWYPNTDQWGKVHAYFEDLSRKSEGRLIFCPIQKGKKDEYGKELCRPDAKDPCDPELRDYYVALSDRNDTTLELWKAYWIANIKKSISDAKRDFDRPLNKVTFVAIYGGAEGAQLERREVIKLGELLKNRQEIEVAMDLAVDSVAKMCVCGQDHKAHCSGCNAVLHLISLAVRKVAFCTPIKSPKLQMMVVTPDDLRDHLIKDDAKELEDAFASGKVPRDLMIAPPEQQDPC